MENKCTLTNEELIAKCKAWVKSLCETGARSWSLSVPVNLDKDPDILFMELADRLAATPPPQGLAKEQKDNIGKLFDKYVSVGCVVTQGDKTEFLYALSGLLKSAAPQTDAVELLDYVKEHWIVGTSGMWRRQTDVRDQRTSNGLLQEYKTFKQNK